MLVVDVVFPAEDTSERWTEGKHTYTACITEQATVACSSDDDISLPYFVAVDYIATRGGQFTLNHLMIRPLLISLDNTRLQLPWPSLTLAYRYVATTPHHSLGEWSL